MSKTLKPSDRKGIVITNDAPLHVYGGVRGPINSMYYETVEKIAAILADKAKVTQVTSKGEKIALDFTNFDKDLDPYDDEIDEVLELITCTPDKIIGLVVTKTATIGTDVDECNFESLNTEVATVTQDGIVTGVKSGETSIRVSRSGYRTVSIPITVVAQPYIKCIPSRISELLIGETITIRTVPTGATFKSKDDGIAKVTEDGVVEGIKVGTTNIIISKEGYQDAKVTVRVEYKPEIKVVPESIDALNIGEYATLTTDPTGATFATENIAYANVDDKGNVKGISGGTTNIIVSKEGYKSKKVPVTVVAKTMQCSPLSVDELYVGDKQKITTEPETSLFSSANILVATVSSEGEITGVKAGKTEITVSKYGYYDVVIPVTVKNKPTITCAPASVDTLYVGEETTITTNPSEGVSFASKNMELATVTQDGVVRGVKAGTTNITVSKEGYKTANVPVTIKDKLEIEVVPETIDTLYVGEETTIIADPTDVSFHSEDEQVATVTDKGVVRGVKAGNTSITISKEGYNDIKVPVTVKQKGTIKCTPASVDTLYVGEETTITSEPTGTTFRSESDAIATVTQQGVVAGVKDGTTNIVVTKAGYNDTKVPVTVKQKGTIKCTPTSVDTLYVGEETTIVTNPTGAAFRSESDAIATVTQQGVVTGVKDGTTNIVVTKEGYNDVKVPVTVKQKGTIKCTPAEITDLLVDEERTITTVPTGVKFSSQNESYVTVTQDGVVRGIQAGTRNIIVSKEGYNDATVKVTVKDKPTIACTPTEIVGLQVGLEETITTVPTGATFRSASDAIATVTQQGVVTGVKDGTTNIVVTKDGHQDASVKVTVIPRKVVTCDPAFITDLVVGQTQQITATPDNATFRVEAEGVITVTEDGLVEAITAGQAKVIVEAQGYKAAGVVVTTKDVE